VHRIVRWYLLLFLPGCFSPFLSHAQIDPYPREMIQLGYNASFQGHAPLAGYAFYYRNVPNFPGTNLTLRLALAPTYLDSELGIRQALGDDTDVGIGVAGGGFADNYAEIREGTFRPSESFTGHSGEASTSIYHCFNPRDQIPLNGVVRFSGHYSTYSKDSETRSNFFLPDDHFTLAVRTGLRWGGKEPLLFPSLAMELSVWYEGQYRTANGGYGFQRPGDGRDRQLKEFSHLFWAQALLAYTMTNSGQSFYVSLMLGGSVNADRFSAYRMGALLPLVSEFPLSLPGYYYQEISAENFVLLGGNYIIPLDEKDHWNINFNATTAGVDYLNGLEQNGRWHSGVGAGVLYKTPALKVMIGYAYGVDAKRGDSRGAHSVGVLMQVDMEHAKQVFFGPDQPARWRGWGPVLNGVRGLFGD